LRENEELLDKIRKNIDSSLPRGVEHVIKALFNSNL